MGKLAGRGPDLGIAEDTRDELTAELAELRAENARLRGLLGLDRRAENASVARWSPSLFNEQHLASEVTDALLVDGSSPRPAKVALFGSLFVGRDDVHALRWENTRTGKAGWGPAVRGGWANARRPDREYLLLTDEITAQHLAGEIHLGLYPLVRGDRCRLLVCDFDGPGWTLDALAYLDAARAAGIPAPRERSRSGDGAHVLVFFSVRSLPRRRRSHATRCDRSQLLRHHATAKFLDEFIDGRETTLRLAGRMYPTQVLTLEQSAGRRRAGWLPH